MTTNTNKEITQKMVESHSNRFIKEFKTTREFGISYAQRCLRIGFNNASEVIDHLLSTGDIVRQNIPYKFKFSEQLKGNK